MSSKEAFALADGHFSRLFSCVKPLIAFDGAFCRPAVRSAAAGNHAFNRGASQGQKKGKRHVGAPSAKIVRLYSAFGVAWLDLGFWWLRTFRTSFTDPVRCHSAAPPEPLRRPQAPMDRGWVPSPAQ
jgi:hypothetical protein